MASTALATDFASLASLAAFRPGAVRSVAGGCGGGGGLPDVRAWMRLRRAMEVAVMLPAISGASEAKWRVRREDTSA